MGGRREDNHPGRKACSKVALAYGLRLHGPPLLACLQHLSSGVESRSKRWVPRLENYRK